MPVILCFQRRKHMRYLLFLVLIFTATTLTYGQGKTPTFYHPNYVPAPFCIAGQMLNTSNAYPGTQLDTLAASTTINLTIADAAVTTFAPYPVFGTGTITFIANCTKISGSPAGTITIQKSGDGATWAPIVAGTVAGSDTFTIANVSGVQSYSWDKPIKYAPYYRGVIATTSATQSLTCKMNYFVNYPNYNASK